MANEPEQPAGEPRIPINQVVKELSRRTLVAWTEALEQAPDVNEMRVEFYMDEGLPKLLNSWAAAIERHQPEYVNARNVASLLRDISSMLLNMLHLGETAVEAEEARWTTAREARTAMSPLAWAAHPTMRYLPSQEVLEILEHYEKEADIQGC